MSGVAVGTLLLTGCEFTGLNSRPLPLTEGSDDFVITIEMANSVNLVANSEVKVDNITVGGVRSIAFRDWHAVLTVALNDDVRLPKNAIARIGQKSLLGAEYLEIAAPDEAPSPTALADGDTIGLEHTGRYPETEEVLSALSLMLNGGGLQQIRTISTELNNALGGRTQDFRSVLQRLDSFVASLDAQRGDIVKAMESLDRFAAQVAAESRTLDAAIETIPAGLRTLNAERKLLVTSLRDVSDFGRQAVRTVTASQSDLLSNLRSLQPVLSRLADAGTDLPESLGIAMLPLPTDSMHNLVRGDYVGLVVTADLSAQTLARNFLSGGPLDGVLQGLLGPTGGTNILPDLTIPDDLKLPSIPKVPGVVPNAPPPAPEDETQPGLGGLLGLLLGGGQG